MSIEPFQRNADWLRNTRDTFDTHFREPIQATFKQPGVEALNRAYEQQFRDLGMEPAMAVCSAKDVMPKLSLLAQPAQANDVQMSSSTPAKGQPPQPPSRTK